MKLTTFIFLLSTVFSQTFANSKYSVSCHDAAGFYGRFLISETGVQDELKVHASNGFSYAISEGLGVKPSVAIEFTLDKKACDFSKNDKEPVRCRVQDLEVLLKLQSGGTETIIADDIFLEISRVQSVTVDGKFNGHDVTLSIKKDDQIGRRAYSFSNVVDPDFQNGCFFQK